MKLLRSNEMKFPAGRTVFRQSRLAGTIGMSVLGAAFLAAGPVWKLLGAPWFIWVPCCAVGALVVLAFRGSIAALYRQSNWVMAIDGNTLWLNLRSHLNHHLPEGQTVLRLDRSEIAKASVHSERYSIPSSDDGGSTSCAMESVQLKLTHADTQSLVQALEQERNRKPVPGILGSRRALHYPVSVPEPRMIRIAWHGSTLQDRVTPSANVAIELLAKAGLPLAASTLVQRKDWFELEDAELDSQVRALALAGDHIAAAELLCQRRRLGLSEAMRQVKDLTAPK